MRLPTIQKGAAANIQTPDLRVPFHEANKRQAAFNAFGIPIKEAAERYEERENNREMQEAILAVSSSDSGFVSDNKGVEEYDPNEINDENFINITNTLNLSDSSRPIPKHKVYAEWRAKNYEESVRNAASGITSNRARDKFIAKYKLQGDAQYMEDSVAASKEQIKYNARQTMTAVDSLLLNFKYDEAKETITNSGMSIENMQTAFTQVDTRKQTDYFYNSLGNRKLGPMQRDLKKLIDNDKDFTSLINEEKRVILINKFQTAISTATNKESAGANAQYKMDVDYGKNMMRAKWNRQPVDDTDYGRIAKAVSAKNPVLAQEMIWTQRYQPEVNEILMQPPTIQEKTYKGLLEGKSSNEKLFVLGQVRNAIDEGNKLRATDTMKFAADIGLVDLEPIDYSSKETIQQGLASRIPTAITAQQRYGTFTGFLTTVEANELGQKLENAPNKTEMFALVNESMGQFSEPFYEQLKKFDIAGIAPFAGQVYSWGEQYEKVASDILAGEKLQKEDAAVKLQMKTNRSNYEAFLAAKVGPMFGGNQKQKGYVTEAFMNLMALRSGGLSTRQEDMNDAFKNLTGGSIFYNDYTIQAPIPDMTGSQYKGYLKDLPDEWWAKPENRMYGYSPKQAKNLVLSGALYQLGKGRGVSYLQNSKGQRVKAANGQTDFLFRFDFDAYADLTSPRFKDYNAKVSAQRLKAQEAKEALKDGKEYTVNERIVREMQDKLDWAE